MLLVILILELVNGRKVTGDVTLGPGQATVISKFCFDFNPQCSDHQCPKPPGHIDLKVHSASVGRRSLMQVSEVREPKVMVALLDDEYFSFPEVSQVWGEANCTDVAKAAKKAFALDWKLIASPLPGQVFNSMVVEKVRPRWWYIALASCSDHSLTMSYELTVQNVLQAVNAELSMDEIGLVLVCTMTFLSFGAVSSIHFKSLHQWSNMRGLEPQGAQLLSLSLLLATFGHLLWLSFFRSYRDTGQASALLSSAARTCVVTAKTCMQILLMFLARGDVICRPGLAWGRQREMLMGMITFGLLGLALEFWGDREASGSPIEYMYDTRPGVALIAIELLWFYAFVSRCYDTWSKETRLRPRLFYKRFGLALSLWFLTLPAVAALASVLAPWVRFRIVFAVNGLTHILASMVMVYIYHIDVAPNLFEMKAKHREAGHGDELQGFLDQDSSLASFGACEDGDTL